MGGDGGRPESKARGFSDLTNLQYCTCTYMYLHTDIHTYIHTYREIFFLEVHVSQTVS